MYLHPSYGETKLNDKNEVERSLLQMRGARFLRGTRNEGGGKEKVFSILSTQFTEKYCKHSKESCQASPKGVYSPFSQQGFYMHNLSKIEEWTPLCFQSKESAPGQCAGIFQLSAGSSRSPGSV